MKYDVLIKDGFVVDGTSAPWYRSDVGVRDGRIVEACRNLPVSGADRVIDAKGLVVCPGFFDMHSHSELSYFAFPTAPAKIMQGVTTEFNCDCGLSCAPLRGIVIDEQKDLSERWYGKSLDIDWRSVAEYHGRIEEMGVSINSCFQVGFGTVRKGVMGYENRAPTKDELDEMKALVEEGMRDGAFGMSTGLMYTPQNFAETDEVIELAKVVAKYGGIHTSHHRRRGFTGDPRGGRDFVVPGMDTQLEGVREVIRIGEEAGIPTTWSHAKLAGRANWGQHQADCFKEIEDARRRGVDAVIDAYPWTYRGGLVEERGMPTWAFEGGYERLVERLKDPETRKELKRITKQNMESIQAEHSWENTLILRVEKEENKEFIGKSLAEVGAMLDKDPCDVYFDLLIDEHPVSPRGISEAMCEDDVRRFMQHPLVMISTDGGQAPEGKLTHPRGYGTYPRILRKYVREERAVRLEEAVRKMTSYSAGHLGIMDRGIIRPGFWADITIFDPINVRERATYLDPLQYPEGIPYVIVNGVVTVDDGEHTGALAGKPLKHKYHI